jgi:class 3 adenylate cyclase/tetratricopeptide (TPR) repeat protein
MNLSEANLIEEEQQLQQAIAHLEGQRAFLGNAVVEAALGPLQERVTQLRSQLSTATSSAERRIVTVLFSDVTGSTSLAEQLDPEEWTTIMNGIFHRLIEPVERYGGTVARLMGDGILAIFGAPIAHEDDPERAILAGLDIVRGAHLHRNQLVAEHGLDFDVRVGINTGLAVVGEVGSEKSGEYTAMGDAVNLAARMEQTARPGTVQIAQATHALIRDRFEVEALHPVQAKGKIEPLDAYRVVGRRADARRSALESGISSILVGRDKELNNLLALAGKARAGRGQIVSIIAEAGMGKSRLIEELKRSWQTYRLDSGRQPLWRELASTSYGGSRPYGSFQTQIQQAAGINTTDSAQNARHKLRKMLAGDPGQEQLQPLYETLLGLDESENASLEGNAFRSKLYASMLESVRAESAGRPTAYVFDDVHWTDAASLALEAHLLQLCSTAPILIILAFRPDQEAPVWELRQEIAREYAQHYTEIWLQPLAADQSGHLVGELFVNCELPQTVRQTILDRSEGNPFFMEEIARALTEQGLLITGDSGLRWRSDARPSDVNIPANVQSLLASRIDRLAGNIRRTLQLAAVIGRSFFYEVLEEISETASELPQHLELLQRVELIQETGNKPEREFIFRHALTQEAAYRTLLRQERRAFHLRVGHALERLFPERVEQLSPLLATHFSEAQQKDKAVHYYTMAGDSSFRLYANVEAVSHYMRALSFTNRIKSESQTLIHLYRRRGRALELLSDYDGSVDNYDEMIGCARERGDEGMELAGLNAVATVYATVNPRFDKGLSRALAKRALELARRLDDPAAESRAHWNLMLSFWFGLDGAAKAVEHGEASLAIARAHDLWEQLAYTLTDLGQAYGGIGKWSRGIDVLEESRVIWRKLGDQTMLANNLFNSTIPYLLIGDYDGAVRAGEEARAISQEIGNVWGMVNSVTLPSFAHWDLGEAGRVISNMAQARAQGEDQGAMAQSIAFGDGLVAWIHAAMGAPAMAEEAYQLAREMADSMPGAMRPWHYATLSMREIEAGNSGLASEFLERSLGDLILDEIGSPGHVCALLARGRLSLTDGELEKSIRQFNEFLALLQAAGIRYLRADALFYRGQALLAQGEEEAGMRSISEACGVAQSLNARRILWPILLFMAEHEPEQTRSDRLFDRARRTVQFVIEQAGSPELMSAFTKLPAVTRLLSPREVN